MFTTSCQIPYYVTVSLVNVFDKGKVSYFLSYLAPTVSSIREWYATTLLVIFRTTYIILDYFLSYLALTISSLRELSANICHVYTMEPSF
jgi:hypothetical protein